MFCYGCFEETETEICEHCAYDNSSGPKEVYHLIPGTLINDHYIVGKALGYGGFGVTYIGFDKTLQRKVAIKEYLPSEFSSRVYGTQNVTVFNDVLKQEQYEKGLRSFVEEAARLAKFNSVPGIVHVYDTFVENNTGYIIMEYLDGITLKEYMQQVKTLTFDETISIMSPVFTALKAVHQVGIIHRDIAPDNIMITTDNRTKLIDFGASRYATTSHSKSLSVILKLGYAPEEQYRSRGNQGPWSDVYAICATIYQMLSGQIPPESSERLANDTLKPLTKLGVKIGKNAENTLMNGLNLRAENRIQSIEELEKGLLGETTTKRVKEKGLVEDIGQWPKWLKMFVPSSMVITATLAILMAFGIINFRGFLQDAKAEWVSEANAPNLVNMTLEEAEETAQKSGFQIGTDAGKVDNDFIPKDTIISQNPQPGELSNKSEKIQVVISGGPAMVEVPRVVDVEVETTKKNLEEMGFVVVVTEKETGEFFDGSICEQSILEDNQYGRKGKIELVVAQNANPLPTGKQVDIPSVIGQDVNVARMNFVKSGVYLRMEDRVFTEEESVINSVVSQAKVGTAQGGEIVNVVLSKGVFIYYVPDLQLKSQAEATKILEEAGSKKIVITEEYHQSITKGQVIRQSIETGQKLKANDEITLVISKGPDTFTIPNLTGMNTKEAKQQLINMQIPESIIKIEKASSEDVHSGLVMKQSVDAGKELFIEDTIILTESTGGTQSDWVYSLPNNVTATDYEIITEREYRTKKIVTTWSDYTTWQSTPISENENTRVNVRYRTQSKETTVSTNASLSGYIQYGTPNKTISTDCSRSKTPAQSNSTTQVTSETVQEVTGTKVTYNYYRHIAWSRYYGKEVFDTVGFGTGHMNSSCNSSYQEISSDRLFNVYAYDSERGVDYYQGSNDDYRTFDCDGGTWQSKIWYKGNDTVENIYSDVTYYKSCPIITTYNYYKWGAWTGWSNGAPPSKNDNLNVEAQYQSSTKSVYKDGEWSEWSRLAKTKSDSLDVETREVYRYRFK